MHESFSINDLALILFFHHLNMAKSRIVSRLNYNRNSVRMKTTDIKIFPWQVGGRYQSKNTKFGYLFNLLFVYYYMAFFVDCIFSDCSIISDIS